jgi:glycosyltransferase involved in cell wall biosynthesis
MPATTVDGRDATWPSVTVVVPTHNRPQLLQSTVRSILAQDYPGWIQLIVVFDREEPRRPDVEVPGNREMVLTTNTRTPGPAGAYNVALLAATGDYFALCDDDDEWLPEKLRLQIELMQRHPAALFGTCGVYLGDGGRLDRFRSRVPKHEVLDLDELMQAARNELHSSTFIVRHPAMLERVGLIDEAIPASYGEDYDWLIRAGRLAPVVAVRKPLVRVRWAYSYFVDRWGSIIDAIEYQLANRPELQSDRENLSRLLGRLAFAHAALGHRAEARTRARESLKVDRTQLRAYLAYLIAIGLVRPQWVVKAAHAVGRGV